MKIGVSTLGCPQWALDEILARLPAYGYEGVELRGIGPDLDLSLAPAFRTPAAAEKTRRRFSDAGLAICSVDTSCAFTSADAAARAENVAQGRKALDLAAAIQSPAVRVFGGSIAPGSTYADAVKWVGESLSRLGEHAAQYGGAVRVVLETHDAFSTGVNLAEVLVRADSPLVGALWDLHHPFRQGESPAETFAALEPYVNQVHVKDSVPGGSYCLLGDGDIPVLEMLRLLHTGGYEGWINLEWEKRWAPQLADPEVAFPQYAARLREYLASL